MRFVLVIVVGLTLGFGWSTPALATAPMVSSIPNQQIPMNGTTGPISFFVTDDITPVNELVIGYQSYNPDIVPNDDDHIDIEGSGANRTVTVTPAAGASGTATIMIQVTDTDGEVGQDAFTVEVDRPVIVR